MATYNHYEINDYRAIAVITAGAYASFFHELQGATTWRPMACNYQRKKKPRYSFNSGVTITGIALAAPGTWAVR